MLRVSRINTFDLPELLPYRTMRLQHEHRKQGLFVAEGEKVVRRLLQSRCEVISVLLPPKWYEDLKPLIEARADQIDVFIAEKRMLETLTGFSMYQGLLALGRVPRSLTLDQMLRKATTPALFVAVEGLSSAENLGGIVRNCAAFGCAGLIVGETCASPYLRRAVRSSMGTIFRLPVIESQRLAMDLDRLKGKYIRCLAAHPHTNQKILSQADFRGDCCIVLGSEGFGISEEILARCDDRVVIPMASEVDSLNVGSAAAAFLYEASRQRGRA